MAQDDTGGAAGAIPLVRPNFWIVAILVIAVVTAGYWFFLRSSYVPVLVNLDPQDAADVARVLEAKKLDYRFESEGRTIAVLDNEADRARVELAGSELPMKGQIGFELFNQSDMGLTEFAQKINYQRALQGELARTILLLDGIQTVRVHLGLPERSLFRGEQEAPKAAVTLILKPGKSLSSATVLGIQRLVAGAVPDLPADAVAVLDGTGRVVSSEALPTEFPSASSDSVVESVRHRLTAAITMQHPDLRFDANVSLRYREAPIDGEPTASATPDDHAPRGAPDYTYVIRFTTDRPLAEGQRNDIAQLLTGSIDFDPGRGDALAFLVGPVVSSAAPAASSMTDEHVVAKASPVPTPERGFRWETWWPVAPLLAIGALSWAFWNDRRRARARHSADLATFADALRQRLEAEQGA